ncbi:probable transcription factor At1g11510 [Actinidia eriantha]|uniref:probable transcription factor At1g11510 n=1 Tax=Actinidia eriantha TaxID=165200 RepID=UPI002585AE40|nr:probable transcription factor At1g11510 [Actinidia eriantha]XP_057488445.1 probable transcription factor At1g11510 [Actinidia eriantha]
MAPNRQPEAEAQGSSSSDEEVEGESSEENESQSESEEEDKTSTPAPQTLSVPTKPDTESGESDSPDPSIKPVASKPMEDPSKSTTKKPRSKSSSAIVEKEDKINHDSKRAKKKAVDSNEVVEEIVANDSKKQLFQRLWSEDDEIEILKGVMEYRTKKGVDPVTDMNDFHDFIKKSLHVAVTRTQLYYKIRRLKKKYENNAGKGKNGVDRSFSNPHEQKAYEWSKKVWGGEDNCVGGDSVKFNGKTKKNQNQNQNQRPIVVALPMIDRGKEGANIEVAKTAAVSQSIGVKRSIGESSLEEEIMKDGLELIGSSKKLELEEKWKKLGEEEVELYMKRVDLIREQTKLVLEAMKSSGH